MADKQATSEPPATAPATTEARRPSNPVLRVTLVVIAICLVLFFYGIAADRYTPYTAQGLVQAYLVRIAPEVGGRVTEVSVATDQRVEPGAVLFRIDPDQYELAVRRGEAQLATAGQSVGASTAGIATAEARLAEAMAHHHYYLQYHLYTVAVHRHLAQRIAGYDYDQHFGGVYYLFVRGMAPAHPARTGVYFDRPPRALIEELDRGLREAAP